MRNTIRIILALFPLLAFAQPKASSTYNDVASLKLRLIGPAFCSGRIADIAVNEQNPSEYYLGVASGGVWKTTNAGVSFTPIFDKQSSYSIGCVTLDPANPNTVWVGTGENNNQRSVAYGDGIYLSEDAGATWKKKGLEKSERIGMIRVHPTNSNVIFVAAYGSVWSGGGERGIYKSIDKGNTWERILHISDFTGCNEVHFDPTNPDIMYAAAHQRFRQVHSYISGGPESAIYKSTDGGKNWRKLENGIPKADLGRIALGISPVNPNIVYALIEGEDKNGGLYRSTTKGEKWERLNDYYTAGNYYQEIYCDPKDENKVYFMDTYCHITLDGGKTIKPLGEKNKHVDNHCMWINPNNTNHLLMGCDGGLYETFDMGDNWQFKENLPITQFYRVSADNDVPFYNVYGGTQDNFSIGGPSRTINSAGIVNSDWFVTNGGDGFKSQIDPTNPNIVYAQAQYGWLIRYDKISQQRLGIKPVEKLGEAAYRWNWDAPLIISPHNSSRLYFAANKVFKSDDRGDSWQVISDDLSRQIDRNKLPMMGKVWSVDAVAKNQSTSYYGNITSIAESPLKQGLMYIGTDDGLVQVTEDDGKTWRKVSTFPNVPETTYVNVIVASKHNENRVFVVFNNHKRADFKPYILQSDDRGKTWKAIHSNLPERGSTYSFAEDHIKSDLFFAGTEFGLFFTVDGGKEWTQLKSGLPTIAVKDLVIQERENDLVCATFGRGIYILDDYTPLRELKPDLLKKDYHLFAVKDAWLFVESRPMGYAGKGFRGESYYAAENPTVGAVFTYYAKESSKSIKDIRREKEKELIKNNKEIPFPTFDEIRAEDRDEKAYLLFTVKSEKGEIVQLIKEEPKKGLNRIVWNLRMPSTYPVNPNAKDGSTSGQLVHPGKYSVRISYNNKGEVKDLGLEQSFIVKDLGYYAIEPANPEQNHSFRVQMGEINRKYSSANAKRDELNKKLKYLEKAVLVTPNANLKLLPQIKAIDDKLYQLDIDMNGDKSVSKREFETPTSLGSRMGFIHYNLFNYSSNPTKTMIENAEVVDTSTTKIIRELEKIEKEIAEIESELEKAGAPHTPGRMPVVK